jgi:hypothetical protein
MGRPKGSKNKPKEEAAAAAKKPRRTKAKPAPAAAPQAASSPSSAQFKKPSPDELVRLVKQTLSRAADQKSLGMQAKELVDKLAETRGLDKKAFGIVRGLYKMGKDNPEKLSVTLPHLLSYIDDLGLAETADKARGLEINGEDDDGDDGQTDLEEAIADEMVTGEKTTGAEATETTGAETAEWPDDQQITRSRLSIVPGPNAPVPEAPPAAEEDKSDAA